MRPVFVPSKNRSTSIKTPTVFKNKDWPVIVVEPQDEEKYRKVGWSNLLVLPKNDGGIAFVRNWILNYAQEKKISHYWMLDDDITAFIVYEGSKGRRVEAEKALETAEKILLQIPKLAQGALEYNQFAWSTKNEASAIGYCDVAVLMCADRIGKIRYRSDMDLKEDRDFTLQLLAAGHYTGRASKIAFAAPKNGSNKGGLSDVYAQAGREATASERMIKAWPGICSHNLKPDGRPDVKINWKAALNYKSPKA